MKIKYTLFVAAALLLGACNGNSKQQTQSDSDSTSMTMADDPDSFDLGEANNLVVQGKYRFTVGIGSADGKQVVVNNLYGQETDLQEFTTAFYQGKQYPIRFEKMRTEKDITGEGNFRNATDNFPYITGALFNISASRIPVNEDGLVYTLLCNTAFANDYESVPLLRQKDSFFSYENRTASAQEQKARKEFEKRYGRSIEYFALYDSIPSKDLYFYVMQFERKKNDVLAVIAAQTKQGYAVLEEHATLSEEGDNESLWRVDGGEVYYPKRIVDCFSGKSDGHMIFLMEDVGGETTNYTLYHIQGDKLAPYGQLQHSYDGDESNYVWYFYAPPM